MLSGILLKGYSGFYYVYAEGRVWECSLRGRFRLGDQDFLIGDRVNIMPSTDNKATIESVETRKNDLSRPSIANVDQAFLVFALVSPEPDLNLLDRLLIQVGVEGIKPVIILNKLDLALQSGFPVNGLDFYGTLGFDIIKVSSETGEGIPEVLSHLSDKVTVLAGPSGVGKSSLVNALAPGMELKTGEISRKLKRGRHTTRHVELMVCGGGLLADTPGFSSLFLPEMKREELSGYFPEIQAVGGNCRFINCLHSKEPDCAVKDAVATGKIMPSRYDHYCRFLEDLINTERRY